MKKVVIILLNLLFFGNIYSQKIDTIPVQKDEFVKGLTTLLNDTKRSELKDLTKEFSKDVKDGKYNETFFTDLARVSNQMIKMRGKAYPQLSGILESFIKMSALNLDPSKWSEWVSITQETMKNAKKGDTKSVLKFLDFIYPLYKNKALYSSKAKSWTLTTDKFKLEYTKKGPTVVLELCEILGYTNGDTIIIQNTLGTYNYFEKKWYGDHGAIDWQRAGIPKKEVFCTFEAYEIDMSTQSYTVDSVIFTYKNYFDKDIKGTLHDKLIANNKKETTNFPKFTANKEDVPLQAISENVIYDGGFTLAGSKILGKGEDGDLSTLTIYKPGTKQKILFATFENITINKPKKVSTSNAEMSLYYGKDSIYHPSINITYFLEENKLKLLKGEGSLSSSKFIDSYHNVEFDADKIEWNIVEDFIDINTVSTSGIKAAIYESKEFFNKPTMRKIRGNVSYDPLSILNIYQSKTGYDEIMDVDYAKKLSPNLSVKQIQVLLFSLIKEGFISWNKKSGIIFIKDKVKHYVMSNAKKKDYDNIRIISKTKKQNGRLNLNSYDIELEGINSVPISKVNFTEFYPDSLKLKLKKNRNMEFNGFFSSGRLDFFGKNNEFIYDEFKMNLPHIDTMIIYIPDGDDFDKYGNPLLKPLNTTLEELSGSLEINDPRNKSGRIDMVEYPKLHSTSNSKVFFDSELIRAGTYTRDKFYYNVLPFDLDSLKNLEPSNIEFKGELYSSDIFPKIEEPLRVQSDLSLGFNIESPPNGFDIYKGKAKFMSDISLNGEGLSGDGQIQYRTVSFESSNIQFFPDSLLAKTDTLGVEKSKGAYESPWVKSANNDIKYYPYIDSLWASSSSTSPFRMYGEIMNLDGTFSVTDEGISGTGTADWDDATLISNHFVFKADEMFADTAELIIKSLDGDKVTFNTPNVNAAVDFIKNTGYFKSNTDENRTEFGYNQYETNIDEFFWDIDNKKLEFNAKEGSGGATFKSLHKKQDSLQFLVMKADYNLQTSIIEAHGVEEILVADSRIIPDSGEVVINPEAKISTLKNAVIEASAITKKHRLENVIVDINGKNDIRATGDYVYKTRDTEAQFINFPSIHIVLADSSVITKKRRKKAQKLYAINGKGQIDKTEDFILYPNVTFYGKVQMFSTYDKLKIKGFTKIDFKSEFVKSDFYEIDSEVDPENLQMDISKAKDPGGAVVRTGIFVSKSGLRPLYTEILNNQIGPVDIPMIETNGILSHNYDKGTYTFGTQEKIDNPEIIQAGNTLEFNPTTSEIHAEGFLDLGTQYGVIKEKVAGTVDANLNDENYSFNTSISFPFKLDKDLIEKIGFYLFEDNFDADDADYTKKKIQFQLAEFFTKPKELKKVLADVETNGFFAKPKSFKENFLISDVNLVYDNDQRAYKSKGKFNLSFIGDKAIHKRVNGYIELGHRMGSDYYSIYLKTSLGDWFYFNFDGGPTNIQIISSFEDVNAIIEGLDVKKRTIKGENKDQFIVYEIGSESKAMQFAKRMKAFGNQ